MKTEIEESLRIIQDLLECINWLGGDAYEVEAADKMCSDAHRFLKKHKLVSDSEDKSKIEVRMWEMVFVRKDDDKKYCVTNNKKHAKNIMNTSLNNVRCIVNYFDLASGKVKNATWAGKQIVCK